MDSGEDESTAHDRMLDAAARAIAAHGYRGMTMSAVATAAGVSRQTVYNAFGDKHSLAAALVLRESEETLNGIDAAMSAHEDVASAVAHAATFALESAADDPLRKAALTGDGLLALLTVEAEPQLLRARERIGTHVRRHWPDLPPGDVVAVVDSAVRLTMSHMMLPAEPPQVVAARISRLVTSYLGLPPPGRAHPPARP